MVRIKNGKCGSCGSELILTPYINEKGINNTYVCKNLGHLNFKAKEDENKNEKM